MDVNNFRRDIIVKISSKPAECIHGFIRAETRRRPPYALHSVPRTRDTQTETRWNTRTARLSVECNLIFLIRSVSADIGESGVHRPFVRFDRRQLIQTNGSIACARACTAASWQDRVEGCIRAVHTDFARVLASRSRVSSPRKLLLYLHNRSFQFRWTNQCRLPHLQFYSRPVDFFLAFLRFWNFDRRDDFIILRKSYVIRRW